MPNISLPQSSERKFLTALLMLVACMCASGVQAEAGDAPQDQLAQAATRGGSSWMFGGGLVAADRGYVGYQREITPIPLIFYHRGRFFFAGFSAGYMASHGRHYRFSLVVKPRINRLSASDSPQLVGIQSRRWSMDGGANLDLFGGWGQLATGVSHDLLNRNNGTELTAGYRYPVRLQTWTVTPELGAQWQNASLTGYYYGVSAAEAIPGRPAYLPGAALNPYIGIGLSKSLGGHWRFFSRLQYTRYAPAIRNSPLVDRSGSRLLFIGFVYNTARQ